METICGADCSRCGMKDMCKGCVKTGGHPFGGTCVIASCCRKRGYERCSDCAGEGCEYKSRLIKEFNSLGIADMPEVTELYQLNGSFINFEYELPGKQRVKFWQDNNVYLGNQLHKNDSDKCYGIAADDDYLLVCEYGEDGAEPQIVVFKKR